MNRNETPESSANTCAAAREQSTGMAASGKSRKAYVYARVKGSACSQINDYMLAAQQEQLLERAKAMNIDVAEQDVEIAPHGITEEAKRRLMEAAVSGMIGMLLIVGCSRLHRETERLIELLEELDQHSVQIYSLKEGWVNAPHEEGQPTMLQLFKTLRAIEQKAGGEDVFPG